MEARQHTYIAIDLKSFYASVECVERGLDPLHTHLVVADASRTEKTICLAVSPSLKSHGIGGRARLFEVVSRVREVNRQRKEANMGRLIGKSADERELDRHPELALDYLVAPPRMARYIEYSTQIYRIYLQYVAPEDILVYSIDEVFMDVTNYLQSYKTTARELTVRIIRDVLRQTGITATAGIGTNLYLCKVAMDIVAKHLPADQDGVRIAELDEMSYRRQLWNHKPLTSFWRVGHGIADRLAPYGIDTMGKIARASLEHEDLLYQLFGVNAELLIDHAWGWEPCTIQDAHAYKPEVRSLSSGQVLSQPYTSDKALVVTLEMADALALEMVSKHLATNQLALTINYDTSNMADPAYKDLYHGPLVQDHYGRTAPKPAHGTIRLKRYSSSSRQIMQAVRKLFGEIIQKDLLVRRINLVADHLQSEERARHCQQPEQLDLFDDYAEVQRKRQAEEAGLAKERRIQETLLNIKGKFGKNAILNGISYKEGATAKQRNKQIGGHQA